MFGKGSKLVRDSTRALALSSARSLVSVLLASCLAPACRSEVTSHLPIARILSCFSWESPPCLGFAHKRFYWRHHIVFIRISSRSPAPPQGFHICTARKDQQTLQMESLLQSIRMLKAWKWRQRKERNLPSPSATWRCSILATVSWAAHPSTFLRTIDAMSSTVVKISCDLWRNIGIEFWTFRHFSSLEWLGGI